MGGCFCTPRTPPGYGPDMVGMEIMLPFQSELRKKTLSKLPSNFEQISIELRANFYRSQWNFTSNELCSITLSKLHPNVERTLRELQANLVHYILCMVTLFPCLPYVPLDSKYSSFCPCVYLIYIYKPTLIVSTFDNKY